MDRRAVLKSLACLGAWPALSGAASFDLPPIPGTHGCVAAAHRVGIISVGGPGRQMLGAVHGSIAGGALLIEAHRTLLDDALTGLDLAIIVAGLGDVAGSSLPSEIAAVTRARGIPTYAVALLPTAFSERIGGEVATTGLAHLREKTIATFTMPLGRAAAGPFCFWRVHASVAPPEKAFRQLLHSLAMPLSGSTALGVNIKDFEEVLSGNGEAATGFGYARGKDAAARATQRAIDHPLLGERRLRTSGGILILVATSNPSISLRCATQVWSVIRDAIPEFFEGLVVFDFMARPESATEEFQVTILAGGVTPEPV